MQTRNALINDDISGILNSLFLSLHSVKCAYVHVFKLVFVSCRIYIYGDISDDIAGVTRAIRLYRHFKMNIGGSRLRSEVNRYTSSAGSFIILQGINLVSVRTEAEGEGGGPARSRVYRFQWQVKYRYWRNYRARKNDFRRR